MKDKTQVLKRTDEWERIDSSSMKYHTLQWDKPKRSTISFEEFCSDYLSKAKNIIDLGAGAGAATAFIASKHPSTNFTAFERSLELTEIGNQISKQKNINNIRFEQGDWYELRKTSDFDGVISLHALSVLPDFEFPLRRVLQNIQPKWFALSSLFYEGDITCRIEVEEYKRDRKCFYNIYSLPAISRLCKSEGYTLKYYTPFVIDIDIEKPTDIDYMATYTESTVDSKTQNHRRLQISGPLLMNWYMLLIEKNNISGSMS